MHQKITGLLVLAMVFGGIALSSNMVLVTYHELAHQEINRHHFINSTIKSIPFIISYVETDMDLTVKENIEKYMQARHYHMLNEIVGYSAAGLSITILGGCMIIAFAIIVRGDD